VIPYSQKDPNSPRFGSTAGSGNRQQTTSSSPLLPGGGVSEKVRRSTPHAGIGLVTPARKPPRSSQPRRGWCRLSIEKRLRAEDNIRRDPGDKISSSLIVTVDALLNLSFELGFLFCCFQRFGTPFFGLCDITGDKVNLSQEVQSHGIFISVDFQQRLRAT